MQFTDSLAREWKLTINIAALRRAKRAGIDLSMPVQQLQQFVMDDVFVTDAIWCVLEPDAGGITLEQFEAGLNGKVLEDAKEALFAALCDYYPDPKADMLRAALASVKQELTKATASLTSNG